jgi:hypothetical protein
MIPLGGAGTGMHVIPVEKAIESEQSSVSDSSIYLTGLTNMTENILSVSAPAVQSVHSAATDASMTRMSGA